MSAFTQTLTLANGTAIPQLGFGTWMIDNADAGPAVQAALAAGYRHLDTAQDYGNEQGVGAGIRASGIAREEIFLTSKLLAQHKNYADAQAALAQSFVDLDVDYIDLMLIHAPQPWTDFRESNHYFAGNLAAWRAMEELYHAGKIRAIGVSNFEEADLQNLLDHAEVPPMVDQILAHISNMPFALIDFCRAHRIAVEAYSPLGHGVMLRNPALADIAAHYGVSVAQLCIRYCLQHGLIALPKTAHPAKMRENAAVDFKIGAADMAALDALPAIEHYGEVATFPIYGGKKHLDGTYTARYFNRRDLLK